MKRTKRRLLRNEEENDVGGLDLGFDPGFVGRSGSRYYGNRIACLGYFRSHRGGGIAFRRRLGRLKVGLILLVLGIALAVAALTSSEEWERAEDNEYRAWVADRRRSPCGPREAMLLLAAIFLAGGGGMAVAGKFVGPKTLKERKKRNERKWK